MRTIEERYDPAMAITDQKEADAYFESLVAEQMSEGVAREPAEKLERESLGYYAGYYSFETRLRVEELFRCTHPVFGSAKTNGPSTPEEAFLAGVRAGRAALQRREKP
jgi:hypothetical protein